MSVVVVNTVAVEERKAQHTFDLHRRAQVCIVSGACFTAVLGYVDIGRSHAEYAFVTVLVDEVCELHGVCDIVDRKLKENRRICG